NRPPANENRVVFALFIISKSGGLIYNREFSSGLAKLSSNDLLMLAGSFHGMHAITAQLCPAPPVPPPTSSSSTAGNVAPSPFISRPTGIEVLESSHFRIQCFQTQTGIKFLLFTEPTQPNIDTMMRKIYELYTDFVMKNPFYTVEMPIRCVKFDTNLDQFIKVRS
ncbi:Sybindin-like protein, partial [Sporormia fimetaria CBS 119925]